MASVSSSNSRKRKQDSVATPEPPAKSSRVNLLNPSHLLQLEIPAVTNTSLPVWDAARSQQVDTTWTINPYCINVHLTPAVPNEPVAATSSGKGNRRSKRKCSVAQTPAPTYNILQPQTIVQTLTQQQGPPQNTSYVLLTNPQSSTPLLASSQQKILVNAPLTDSINVSLPVIIAQLQPALQAGVPAKKPTFPTIQTLMVTPVKPKAAPKALSSFSFHTRTSAVQICDEFLLNLCRAGQNCELHHTPYPFHWQLWCVTSQQWVDFPPHSQVLLERMYSNVNQSSICIKDGSHRLSLIFDTMLMSDTSKYSGVRRLTNSECLTRNPYFPSNYKIYWLNYPEWHEYNQEVSTLLKQKMTDGIYECTFTVGSQKYRVNFTTMTQTNIATGSQREVRLRPAYRSPESMRPYLQTGIQSESSESIGDPPAANFSVDPLKEFSFWYPPVWSPVFGQDYTLVDVPPGTLAFKTVQSFFNESLPETAVDIISIQQVQNLLLWDKYQRQKVFMQKRHTKSKEPLERHLFHGTTKKAAEDICHNNFDPRVAGVNGTSFGRGSYFATKASISSVYSVLSSGDEVHHMFLAKVLVGQVCLGRANYRRPPPLSSRSRQYLLYDTCVDRMDKPTMFVVFDSCQCYPYYLIRYKTLPGEVEI